MKKQRDIDFFHICNYIFTFLSKNRIEYVELNSAAVLARNKARVLIEQDYVLSIYLSKHNILSTYDGDYICWHVMFGHRIESL